jgi:energy-coupling factor transporter ATP-binding protein EcfA2
VFQNPRTQLFHLRVEDEVAFGPYNLGLPPEEIKARVAWALSAVGLEGFRQRNPASLSGGEMQRLAIASALAMRPQVLVLDEPTASLDVAGTHSVIDTLTDLRAQHDLTLIIVEHRLAEVRRLADKVMVLDQGRPVAYGPFAETLNDRALLRRYGLRRPTAEPLAAWKELLVPTTEPPDGREPLLKLEGLSASYDGKPVVHDVDLSLYPGEFVALVGDNGAGKSTLALAAAGLIRPVAGEIASRDGRRPLPGRDVALLFQDPSDQLFTDTVDEEVAFGPRNYRCFDPALHQRTLSRLDLLALEHRRPTTLSMGQQQRTTLAACLALRPQLVILDEPTMGQDWRHLQQLMEFLARLNRRGTAILLITHDYKLVHRYARRVVVMREGRVAFHGSVHAGARPERSLAEEKEAFGLAS